MISDLQSDQSHPVNNFFTTMRSANGFSKGDLQNYVIQTDNELQVIRLKRYLGKEHNNIGFWGDRQQDFNVPWFWTVNDKNQLWGSSGYGARENAMQVSGLPLILFSSLRLHRLTIIKRGEPGWQDYSVFKGLFPAQAQHPTFKFNKGRGR